MALDNDTLYTSTDIGTISGLGPSYTKSFYNKGFYNLFELLLDFPFKYLDQTKLTKIKDIKADGSYYLIDATIASVKLIPSRKSILKVYLCDDNAYLETVFFNLYPNQIQQYKVGRRLLAFGPIKPNAYNGSLVLSQPTVTFLNQDDTVETQERLTPVYHAVEKVPQGIIRKVINGIVLKLKNLPLAELLPKKHNHFALTINQALDLTHYPYPNKDPKKAFLLEKSTAFKRLCFEELVAYQLTLLSLKDKNDLHKSSVIPKRELEINAFIENLPFTPTNAQKKAYLEISEDLSKDKPMLRLLHGDVGSGKTLVALLACLQTYYAKYQCVILAPTELLASQHYNNLSNLLKALDCKIALLTSSVKGNQRKALLEGIKTGEIHIIVGTHSLFQADVIYHNLALAIIDEQHRFGIDQRIALLRKAPQGIALHQLVMTATPIPRTLQLALFSDLDVSTLDELPKGRKPIITAVMQDEQKPKIIRRLKEVCEQGAQAYWVCPNIDENEDETASVKATYKQLKQSLPNLNIGLLHGQLSTNEKTKVMKDFLEGKYQILVATTIIEVGVDVPNASIIVIEGADRLGLAQLHQLRGRVGRGAKESYCILVYKKDPEKTNEIAQKRLSIMKATNNGFTIATEDLKLRGPGEVLGQMQKGFGIFRIVDVNRDYELIDDARAAALDIIHHDKNTAVALMKRWYPSFKV